MKNHIIKQLLTGLLCTMCAWHTWAQQKPHYTQYILNQYILNPAITGIENYTDLKISHRHQWTGIEDAPVTTYFTLHTPINKTDYRTTATSFEVPGENPRGKSYWENYTAAEPHHGVGVQVINDRTGPFTNISALATYAYHLGISPRTSVSAGFGAGITRTSLDASKLNFATQLDPVVANSNVIDKIRPDLNAGLYLYSSTYFIGLSAQQIIPGKLEFSDNIVRETKGKQVPHLFATAGYRLLITEDLNVTPSVLVKYVSAIKPQVDFNAKLQFRDLLWAGASFRSQDGFAGMVGLNISNTLNVGYAYDYTTTRLNNFSKGTHEVIVGFLIGNRYGDTCPRNVW